MPTEVMLIGGLILVVFVTLVAFATRYKRCPSDKILVVYGKVGGDGAQGRLSARCTHGGAAFIWPVIQDYQFLDLTPMPIEIKLEGALSKQNIRVNTPATFMVGISTEPGVMENAAERLLGLEMNAIAELARDIIFGQMRVVIATMPIEEINADRDKLIMNITESLEVELKKIGLRLINVNIQDITDESGYIEALGREAAAHAINQAKIQVAEKERDGAIGSAKADQDKRVQVATAMAKAVEGENLAAVQIAQSGAARREKEAEAQRLAVAAEKVKSAEALQESYKAEESAERQRAKREEAAATAIIIVQAEIERRKIEVMAEAMKRQVELQAEAEKRRVELLAAAEAERLRVTRQGEADGLKAVMQAQAAGIKAQLDAKAEGFRNIVQAAGGAEQAARLMVTELLPQLVAEQVKAIANLKIDKVTVWDGGRRTEDGKTTTADFVSGLAGSIPPLHDIARSMGVELPGFLGKPASPPAAKPATPGQKG